MLIAGSLDLASVLAALRSERPVFHSEDDFKFSLAWMAHELDPRLQVRLETRPEPNVHLDMLLTRQDLACHTALELKYLTRTWSGQHDAEAFTLTNQSAHPVRTYDVIRDVQRVERFVTNRDGWNGVVLVLTNSSAYWTSPGHGRQTNADAFRLHEGNMLHGVRAWGPLTSVGTRKDREAELYLVGHYKCSWQDYSALPGTGGRFRILALCVPDRRDHGAMGSERSDMVRDRTCRDANRQRVLLLLQPWAFASLKEPCHRITERTIVSYISPGHDTAPFAQGIFNVLGDVRPPPVGVHHYQEFVTRRQVLCQSRKSRAPKRTCCIRSPFGFHKQLVSLMPNSEISFVVSASSLSGDLGTWKKPLEGPPKRSYHRFLQGARG